MSEEKSEWIDIHDYFKELGRPVIIRIVDHDGNDRGDFHFTFIKKGNYRVLIDQIEIQLQAWEKEYGEKCGNKGLYMIYDDSLSFTIFCFDAKNRLQKCCLYLYNCDNLLANLLPLFEKTPCIQKYCKRYIHNPLEQQQDF